MEEKLSILPLYIISPVLVGAHINILPEPLKIYCPSGEMLKFIDI